MAATIGTVAQHVVPRIRRMGFTASRGQNGCAPRVPINGTWWPSVHLTLRVFVAVCGRRHLASLSGSGLRTVCAAVHDFRVRIDLTLLRGTLHRSVSMRPARIRLVRPGGGLCVQSFEQRWQPSVVSHRNASSVKRC